MKHLFKRAFHLDPHQDAIRAMVIAGLIIFGLLYLVAYLFPA